MSNTTARICESIFVTIGPFDEMDSINDDRTVGRSVDWGQFRSVFFSDQHLRFLVCCIGRSGLKLDTTGEYLYV